MGPVLSGVPRGTILGPLSFLLFINHITDVDLIGIKPFSDNCVCFREIKDSENTVTLHMDVDRLGYWARSWGMRLQPVKCNKMEITREQIKKINASYTL